LPSSPIPRSSLRSNTLTLAVSNVGTAALSFVLAVLIGRGLGEAGLGAYAVALAWVMPLSLLAEFGIGTLLTRDLAQTPAAQGDLVHAAIRARLWLGGAAMLALIVVAPLLANDPALVVGIQLSAPLILIQPLYSTYTAVFRSRGEMRPIPLLNIGMLAVQVILSLMVLSSGFGVQGSQFSVLSADTSTPQVSELIPHSSFLIPQYLSLILINTLTSALQLAACWGIYRRRFYAPPSDTPRRLTPLLRAAWHFGLAALFAALQVRLSTILLENIVGLGEAGYYAAANRFIEAARLLPNAFFGAAFPALAALAANPTTMRATFRRAALLMGGYGVLAAGALALVAAPLLALTYGAAFAPAAPALVVMGVGLVFSLLRGLRTLYWYARGREAFVNAVNGGIILLQLVLSLWLIPRYGAAGAALALTLVEAAGLGTLVWGGVFTHKRKIGIGV
jgi:O-antigen/teichoic acid export membrane protein